MSELSWAETKRRVHIRAAYRCEYCHTGQKVTGQSMHVEHIDPNAGDTMDNLCLSCASCNFSKAQAIAAPDPATGDMVALFNPRIQVWNEHFAWVDQGLRLIGKTAIGRATIARLKINNSRIVGARKVWVRAGEHPPVTFSEE